MQTRRAAAIERADEGLDRVLSNLQASCSSTPAAPPVGCSACCHTGMAYCCSSAAERGQHSRLHMQANGILTAAWDPHPFCGHAALRLTPPAPNRIWPRPPFPAAQVSSKFAAVLVPLFEDPVTREVHVVLNQRSSRLNTHSGEPGCLFI